MISKNNVVYYSIREPLYEVLLKAKAGEEITIWEYGVSEEDARVIQKRLGVNDMRTPDVEALKDYIRNEFAHIIVEESIKQEVKFKLSKRD